MRKGSLQSKFVLLAALVILVPLMVTNTMAIRTHRSLLSESMRTLSYNNVVHVGLTIGTYVQNANELSTSIIANSTLRAFLLSNEEDPDYMTKTALAADALNGFPVSSIFIRKASVYPLVGRALNNNNYSALPFSNAERERALALKGHLFWEQDVDSTGESMLSLCRSVRDTRNLSHQIGFVKVALNLDSMRKALLPPKELEQISYHILNPEGTLLLSTDEAVLEAFSTSGTLYELAERGAYAPLHERGLYLAAYAIDQTDWLLLSIAPDTAAIRFDRTLFQTLTLSALICVAVCLLIAVFFAGMVTKPLKHIGDLMASVSGGDFTGKLQSGGFDELTLLENQFNNMNERLNFLYNEVFQNELRIREAELSALVSQMNPHFLYNILDTIYWMAKSGQNEAVSDMVSNLSKLMRLSLSGSREGFISLATELEQIRCYLAIQRIRFQDQILFELETDESLLECRVLKLILQPLVENAIMHGINPVGSGTIHVRVAREGDELIYRVSNTGKILNLAEIEACLTAEKPQRKGFALKNINDRLTLSYGAAYRLQYGNEEGRTFFLVRQPMVHEGQSLAFGSEKEES
ncbi:MAG: sensor histidine kinase [Clostridia bacterium]